MEDKIRRIESLPETDQVAEWKKLIALGESWRWNTSGYKDDRWRKYRRWYKGRWGKGIESGIDSSIDTLTDYVPVNRIFAYVRSLMPKVYFRNPGVVVTKAKNSIGGVLEPDDVPVIQAVADYIIKELNVKKVMKRAVLSAFLNGVGIVKTGFSSEYIPAVTDKTGTKSGSVIEYSSRVKSGLPWVSLIDPMDFVVPYGTRLFGDSRWCAQRVWRHIEDAQADANYSHKDEMKPTAMELAGNRSRYAKGQDVASWVLFWEIRDKATGKLMIISESGEHYHYIDDDPLMTDGFPYYFLIFDEDLDSCWGISSISIMEPQQLELNDIRSQQSAHRKREVTKFLVDPGAIDDDDTLAAINDASEPMAAIKVNDPQRNVTVVNASMPADLQQSADTVDNDIRFEVGFSRNQGGEVSTGRRTAFEIGVAREASDVRNDERRDETADVFASVVMGLLRSSFKLMDNTMVQSITGGSMWSARDPDKLALDLDLNIEPEEAKPVNTDTMRQDAVNMYSALANNPVVNPIVPVIDLVKAFNRDPREFVDPEVARLVAAFLSQRQQQQEGGRGA